MRGDKTHTLSCYTRNLPRPVHQRGFCGEGWVSGLVGAEVSDVEDAIDCNERWLVEPCSDIVLVQRVAVHAHGRRRWVARVIRMSRMSSRRSRSRPLSPLRNGHGLQSTLPCLDNASLLINGPFPSLPPPSRFPCFRRVYLNKSWTLRRLPPSRGHRCPQAALQPQSARTLQARPLRDAGSRPPPPQAPWTSGTTRRKHTQTMDPQQGGGSESKDRL